MGTGKKGAGSGDPRSSRLSSGSQARANLPPKPASQKRVRRAPTSSTMPPPANASGTSRATGQKGWSRRSASWTPQEDARLVELVKKESAVPPSISASKTWSRVASQLTNRTGKQCRERYLNQLKPGIRRDPWSPEEERILRETHAKIGNKWVTIAQQLPGRTDNCVKNHWNSMLRKRQRREAALRATEAEVVATLGSAQGHKLHHDFKSEADLSVHTGYATPSGVSSSYHDLPTSGVPSPYTASSPITPKRDSKLQISTLVAHSRKELLTWSVPYVQHVNIGPALYGSEAVKAQNAKLQMSAPVARNVLGDSVPLQTSSPHLCANRSAPLFPALLFPNEANSPVVASPGCGLSGSPMPKVVVPSPMRSMMSPTSTDQRTLNSPETIAARDVRIAPPVRRSSRLLSYGSKNTGPSTLPCKPMKSLRKTRMSSGLLGDEVGANPLAALAAAASSVPPSPLTPESRFSATSRSRSVSPDPRLWQRRSKATACTNSVRAGLQIQKPSVGMNTVSRSGPTGERSRSDDSECRRAEHVDGNK